VLVQALQYLYQIKESKGTIPSVIFVADDNEYFLLASKYFNKYLNDPKE
jgi:penicillin-binding protein-related factor A (putative recombinase)